MTYKFSQRSLDRMKGVHGDLVKVMLEAIKDSPLDFGITEGVRTYERQQQLYADGKSLTLNSRHLKGLAVDIAIYVDGEITWEFRHYETVAKHILKVCAEMGIAVVWGGMWRGLRDGPHFELDRKVYP